MPQQALGQECTMTVGGLAVAALLQGASPNFQYASQPKLTSGPQDATPVDQALLGYTPSTGARSGFQINFQLPHPGKAFIDMCLTPAGVDIILDFGYSPASGDTSVGGVKVTTCICESLEITGTEGSDITGRATFQSVNLPVADTGNAAPAYHDFWRFNDVTNFTLPARTHVDVNAFSWRVTRVLAAYRGNSPTGVPKFLRIARTECFLDATYLKHDDQEAAIPINPTLPLVTHDASVLLTPEPFVDKNNTGSAPSTATLTLTCKNAFADGYPTTTGDFETFITEQIALKSATGTYTTA